MCLCVYVYVCAPCVNVLGVCLGMCMCLFMSITHVCMCLHAYVCFYVYVYRCVYGHVDVHVCVQHVCVYVICVYACVCVLVCGDFCVCECGLLLWVCM